MIKESKIPFGKVLMKTLKYWINTVDRWKVWLSYAFILSLLSLLFQRWSYGCLTDANGFWCDASAIANQQVITIKDIIYHVLMAVIILAYIYDYYQTSFCNQKFTFNNIFIFGKEKIKSMIFFVFVVSLIIAAACVAYFLIRKPANPNWMIEFIYFLIVFVSLLIPLMIFRLSSFISYYLQDGRMPNLLRIYKDTAGRSFTPFILLFLTIILDIILLLKSGAYLKMLNLQFNNFAVVFLSETAGYIVILICYSLIISVCRAQHEILESFVSRETLVKEGMEKKEKNKTEKPRKQKSTKTRKAIKGKSQKSKKIS